MLVFGWVRWCLCVSVGWPVVSVGGVSVGWSVFNVSVGVPLSVCQDVLVLCPCRLVGGAPIVGVLGAR